MNPTIKASPKNVRQSFNQTMLPQSVASPTQQTSAPIAPTIDASRLTTNSVVVPPPVASNTAQNKLNSTLGTMGQNLEITAKETAKAPAEAPKPTLRDTITDRLSSILNLQSTQGDRTAELQKEQGLFEKQQVVTDLENQYRAKERFYTKEEEKIRKNVEGKTATAIEQDVATLNRQKNSELADIAIQQQAASGNYRTAFDIVEAKIAAEFEPLQNEIETLKTMYSFYQNDLTESEKLEAQARIQEKEAALNFERNKEMARYEQELQQSDPLYRAQVANIYSQIDARNAAPIGKPPTQSQLTVAGYRDRLVNSNKIINQIGGKFTGASSYFAGAVPNILKTDQRQSFEQAQRDFINAVLRRESGATITDEEFDNARKQYFPQPGDAASTVQQKALNRSIVINSFNREASGSLTTTVIAPDGTEIQITD